MNKSDKQIHILIVTIVYAQQNKRFETNLCGKEVGQTKCLFKI